MLVLLQTPVATFCLSEAPVIRDDLHLAPASSRLELHHAASWEDPPPAPALDWRSDDCRAVVVTTFPAADRL
jgi:hypothetical protein